MKRKTQKTLGQRSPRVLYGLIPMTPEKYYGKNRGDIVKTLTVCAVFFQKPKNLRTEAQKTPTGSVSGGGKEKNLMTLLLSTQPRRT